MTLKEVTYRESYKVNSLGEVFNLKTGRKLKQSKIGIGYLEIRLGREYRNYVHRIIYDAFVGLKKGFVVDHINGNRKDNRLINLQQISQSENVRKGIGGRYNLPKYITRKYKKDLKSGYSYSYRFTIDGKRKTMFSSTNLDSVISFKYSFESIVF